MNMTTAGLMFAIFAPPLIIGVVLGLYADSKGLNGRLWFWYGLLVPPIAIAHMFIIHAHPGKEYRDVVALEQGEVKRCAECAELVRKAARKCRHCGYAFPDNKNSRTRPSLIN